MKKTVIMITDGFPYGKGEKTFILPQIPCLRENFNLIIVSIVNSEKLNDFDNKTILDEDILQINYRNEFSIKRKVVLAIKALFSINFWRDVTEIMRCNEKRILRIINSLKYYANSIDFAQWLENNAKLEINERVIIYNIWCNKYALGACLLKKYKPNLVTRFLGYDLYNERRSDGRQCYRWLINKNIDLMFFEAENMIEYYSKNFKKNLVHEKMKVGRIGTKERLIHNPDKMSDATFVIVSCSNVIPLKRVELIAEGLKFVTKRKNIKWIHFGDGESFDYIKKIVGDLITENDGINVELRGRTPNKEIIDFYQENHVDCFITTTSTEGGVPVALVEALAYGIPVIATDVADIKRTVNENGFLLPENPSAVQVAECIEKMIELTDSERAVMRKKSLEIWKEYYDEDVVLKQFINDLNAL